MSNEQDMLIWKLDKELARARLTLGKIYTVIDKSPFWNKEVSDIANILQEFFNGDKGD